MASSRVNPFLCLSRSSADILLSGRKKMVQKMLLFRSLISYYFCSSFLVCFFYFTSFFPPFELEIELKRAKYSVRPVGLVLGLSLSVVPQGLFSICPSPEKKKLLTVALLYFYPISDQQSFLNDVLSSNTQCGLFAIPLAQINGCSGLSWSVPKPVMLLLSWL